MAENTLDKIIKKKKERLNELKKNFSIDQNPILKKFYLFPYVKEIKKTNYLKLKSIDTKEFHLHLKI